MRETKETTNLSPPMTPTRLTQPSTFNQAASAMTSMHLNDLSEPMTYPTTPYATASDTAAYSMMPTTAATTAQVSAAAANAANLAAPHGLAMSMTPNLVGWNSPIASVPYVMTMPGGSQSPVPVTYGSYPPTPSSLSHEFNVPTLSSPAGMVPVGRTVYIGNMPPEASAEELLDLVHYGPIENVRLLPEKACAFISFLCGQVAAAFHADSSVRRISLHNRELKIGWGKPSVPPPAIVYAVQHQQASRNVYFGQLDEHVTEETLRSSLSKFGPIDQVKLIREQNIAFVHFLSIQTAMKVVTTLPMSPEWSKYRINYGKDRCAYVPKGQQQIQAHNHQAAAMGLATAMWLGYPTSYSNYGHVPPCYLDAGAEMNTTSDGSTPARLQGHPLGNVEPQLHQFGNRTVYLGNLHPDTTAEDICNHVRGGILQSIRYMPDRHIAFITFVDHNAALTFFHMALVSGITVHNRRLKIGWGKPTGPLSPAIALAVQSGASRNVYIGNVSDPALMNENKIRTDLSAYGELEMVNTLPERNCVRINELAVLSAW